MWGREVSEEEKAARRERLKVQGARLAKLRESYIVPETKKSMKQKDLAKELGVSVGLIKLIEIGERDLTPEKLKKCAEVFQVRPEYITGESSFRDRAAELADAMPEEDRVMAEGCMAVWRSAERWIQAAFPGESLQDLEEQGRINLFEVFCRAAEPVRDSILLARLPATVREKINRGELSLEEAVHGTPED